MPRTLRVHDLFIGVYPTGIVYADRGRQQHGDYRRVAFLPYDSLALAIVPDCPDGFRPVIERHANALQRRRGQDYPVSATGQTVRLGGRA